MQMFQVKYENSEVLIFSFIQKISQKKRKATIIIQKILSTHKISVSNESCWSQNCLSSLEVDQGLLPDQSDMLTTMLRDLQIIKAS